MREKWSIELLGGLRLVQGERVVSRFSTQKTGGVLAYLAYHHSRATPREVLCDLLWPDSAPEAARNSLSVALASLRLVLEPPDVPAGAVLLADRFAVRLNPDAVSIDAGAFDAALRSAPRAETGAARAQMLMQAADLYTGPLLPGHYEEWVLAEQRRLSDLYAEAVHRLVAWLSAEQEYGQALHYAHGAVRQEPLREEAHADLIQLLVTTGQPAAALAQYQNLERLLKEHGEVPSDRLRAMMAQLPRPSRVSPPSPPLTTDARPKPTVMPLETAARVPDAPAATAGQVPDSAPGLPLQFTRFFGRETEIVRLQALLTPDGERLVTVTGSGGTGKTRLALEVARRSKSDFPGAVWFVPLADIADARLLVGAIAEALRLPRPSDREPLDLVADALSQQRALLLLDNFEQIVDGGTPVVQTLLERAPSLSVLVTSRQILGLAAEREFPLNPLPSPRGVVATPEQLCRIASVQLFIDRAQAVRPDFQITAGNASAIAELCDGLEGIPLAIELAASRAQVLTAAQMVDRLSQRLDFLVSRRRHARRRHRTLRAAIDWSYCLLSPALQTFFANLSVFRGGWDLKAAESVCGEDLALDYLAQLRECSLVLTEETDGEMRFRLLEALRQFGAERLAEAERRALSDRHEAYYRELAEAAETEWSGRQKRRWTATLEREHENLRAALAWCRAQQRGEAGLRIAGALAPFWMAKGHGAEGRRWLELWLPESDSLPASVRAKALYGAGILRLAQGERTDALTFLEESLDLYERSRDRRAMATVLRSLWGVYYHLPGRRHEGTALIERSLALCRDVGDREGIAASLDCLGMMARERGDDAQAETFHQESLTLYRALDDPDGMASALGELGYLLTGQGEYERAGALLDEALALCRQQNNAMGVAHTLWLLGRVREAQEDYPAAIACFTESAETARAIGVRQQVLNALGSLGLVAERQKEYETAFQRYNDCLLIAAEVADDWNCANYRWRMGWMAIHLRRYGLARPLFGQGLSALQPDQHTPMILACLEGAAYAAAGEKQPERAARLFGAVEALGADAGHPPALTSGDTFRESTVATIRAALGESTFSATWAAGRHFTMPQAIHYAQGGTDPMYP